MGLHPIFDKDKTLMEERNHEGLNIEKIMGNPPRKWPQIVVLFLCNVSVLSFGMQLGWLSPLQPAFQSDDSPLGIPPLTIEQISWIGSLPSISLILASPLFGYCLNKYGRKKTCLIATAPNLIHYLILLTTSNIYLLYLARLIGGFCSCGGFVMVPIYINEISESHLRGLLGGLMGFVIKIGIIFSYVVGTYASYTTLNLVSSLFTVLFLICYSWMPESPVYLVAHNKRKEAYECLRKLRGSNDTYIERELKQIEHIIECETSMKSYSLKHFFTGVSTVRALIIVCGIFTFQMLCGYPAMVRYAVNIIQRSSSGWSANVVAIIVAVSQLVCSLIGATLIDKAGRKSILMISTASMLINLVLFSAYLFSHSYFEGTQFGFLFNFLPNVSLILFICSYALGYGSVPFVILPEIFAPEARAKASMLSNVWISVLEFIIVKMFPTISHWIGLAPTLLIFATHCGLGLVFYHYVMIETKGLDFDEIQTRLTGRKSKSYNPDKEMLKPLKCINGAEKELLQKDTV